MLQGVPGLGWGKGKDCTFIGALEAALAVTERPCKYSDLMGWSGMAFRVRWFVGKENGDGCPSAAVAEFHEEMEAVQKMSGWQAHHLFDDEHPNISGHEDEIKDSIDKGLPVLVYDPGWDVAVVYGYEDEGDTLLLRSYSEQFSRIKLADSPAFVYFLDKPVERPTKREAFLKSLNRALTNCKREPMQSAKGNYYYGDTGFEKWIECYDKFHLLPKEKQEATRRANGFCYITFLDCKAAAATFLNEYADLMGTQARVHLGKAAEIYQQQLPRDIPAMGDTDNAPEQLLKAREIASEAIAMLEKALAVEKSDS